MHQNPRTSTNPHARQKSHHRKSVSRLESSLMATLWRNGYGAIPQQSQHPQDETFLPGPVDVKTFPDRWRKAPLYILIIIVATKPSCTNNQIICLFGYALWTPPTVRDSTFESIVWDSYDWSALEGVAPISRDECLARQGELAEVLGREGVDAFVAEPGGTSQYYVNVSSGVWDLTERPFLLVVTPEDLFFLAPLFEVSRAKTLNIVANETKFVTWAEGAPTLKVLLTVDASPYKTLLKKLPPKSKVMVDDNVRSFISQNLIAQGASVLPQSPNVAAIRETKSAAEITILKAVSPNQPPNSDV